MSSVIPFTPRQDEDEGQIIWVCKCGCSTFELHANGSAVCACCHKTVTTEQAQAGLGWYEIISEIETRTDQAPLSRVRGNSEDPQGLADFARVLAAKRAAEPSALAIISIHEDDTVTAWSAAEADADIDDVLTLLDCASDMIEARRKNRDENLSASE